MSPLPSSDSEPFESRIVRESTLLARGRKCARKIRLDQAGDHVHGRTLRGQNQVNADCARHLRQSRDGLFDVARIDHHQIGEFVDHDDEIGKRLVFGVLDIVEERERLRLLERAVVLVDVAHAALRQQLQALFHFARGVPQNVGRDPRIGDDRRDQVRNILVETQLKALRIDEHHFHVFGALPYRESTSSAS